MMLWYFAFSCLLEPMLSCSINLFNSPKIPKSEHLDAWNPGGIISPMQSPGSPTGVTAQVENEKNTSAGTAWRKTSTPRRGAKSHGKHGSQNTGRNLTRAAFLKEEGPTNLRMTRYLSRTARFNGSSWLKWMKPEKNKKIMLPITTQD